MPQHWLAHPRPRLQQWLDPQDLRPDLWRPWRRWHKNLFSWNITLGHEGLKDARGLFRKMPSRDTVSWNLMFAAYARSGHLVVSRNLFDSIPPRTFGSGDNVLARGAIKKNPSLVQESTERGNLRRARDVFDRMPLTDLISWTTIVTGHVARGKIEEGSRRCRRGALWMIQASCQEGDVDAAASLFTAMPPGRDCSSWTSMISGYARNDRIGAAVAVFWRMPTWSLISWNAMAIAPAESGDLSSAKNLFDRIPEKNCASWNAMIQAYTASGDLIAAVEVFDPMPQPDVISFTTIAVAIAQGGDLDRTSALLDAMPEQKLVSWNAMMAASHFFVPF